VVSAASAGGQKKDASRGTRGVRQHQNLMESGRSGHSCGFKGFKPRRNPWMIGCRCDFVNKGTDCQKRSGGQPHVDWKVPDDSQCITTVHWFVAAAL
jgi:hypothetical protein